MVTLFVVVAWLVALGSWVFVSQATAGVAGMCFACFVAISARIAQASMQHIQIMDILEDKKGKPTPLERATTES